MVRLNRIYTRSGDTGSTGLVGGARRPKHDRRIEAIGAVDEANAAIGVARLSVAAWCQDKDRELARVQNDLFDIGADLATPDAHAARALRISADYVGWLEERIDAMNAALEPLSSFVLPAGTPAAAHLHFARTVVRRAERAVCLLRDAPGEWVNPRVLAWLNRLSDYLFVMARLANRDRGGDVLWQPRPERNGRA